MRRSCYKCRANLPSLLVGVRSHTLFGVSCRDNFLVIFVVISIGRVIQLINVGFLLMHSFFFWQGQKTFPKMQNRVRSGSSSAISGEPGRTVSFFFPRGIRVEAARKPSKASRL